MSDTGWKSAGTGSGLTNSSNITSSNDTYATASHTFTEYNYAYETLDATNFGFEIPVGATIIGVQMRVEGSKDASGGVIMYEDGSDDGPALKGVTGSTDGDVGVPDTEAYQLFPLGSSENDLWGATIGVSDVNDSSFGVSIPFSFSGESETIDLSVDNVQMKVFYEPLNTGWVSPGTTSESGSGEAWTDENEVKDDDTDFAYAVVGSAIIL